MSSKRIKIRSQLAREANKVLLGPLAGAAPANVVRSIPEAIWRTEISRHVGVIHLEAPARIVTYPIQSNYPMWFRREKALDATYTYLLHDVIASPGGGLVWLDDDSFIFQESFGSLQRFLGWGKHREETLQRRQGKCESGILFPGGPYYHWLLEIVPSFLRCLRYVDQDPEILIARGAPSIVREALDTLGVAPARIRQLSAPVKVNNLILSARTPYSGFIEYSDIELARSLIDVMPPSRERSIYISRRGTTNRRLANERELEDQLRDRGFEIIAAERLGLLEQAQIFSEARHVVSPHGAGLSNLIWRQDHECTVIEIFPADVRNDCYARLASLLRFDYRYICCEPDESSSGSIPVADVIAELAN